MTKTMKVIQGSSGFRTEVDGKTVASIGDDLKIWLWEGNGMRLLGKLEGHKNAPWSMAYLADGKRLATAGLDMTVRIGT